MRKENAKFETKFISESGSYLKNMDYFAFVELKDFACYVVADGIDIDEKKESAKLAVTTVISEFSDAPGMSAGKLKRFFAKAHQALLQEAEEIRLEASMVIVLTDYKKVIWGHVGNSRLLWIKDGNIKFSTKDTSLTQRMIDQEEIPMDQLSIHEERNNLYAYLGQPGRFTPVISRKRKLEDGDILLLLTRGVWENVGEAEIKDAVEGISKPEDVCTGLEDVILSQRLEIIENYTIAAIFVNKIYQNPKAGKYKKVLKIVIAALMMVLVLLGSVLVMKTVSFNKKISTANESKKQGINYLIENKYTDADKCFKNSCESIDKLNLKKDSKRAQKYEIMYFYRDMNTAIVEGKDNLGKKKYKTAYEFFIQANDKLNSIIDDGNEDTSRFADEIIRLYDYATAMNEGVELLNSIVLESEDTVTESTKAMQAKAKFVEAETICANEEDDNYINAKEKENEALADYYILLGNQKMRLVEESEKQYAYGAAIDFAKGDNGARKDYEQANQYKPGSADLLIDNVDQKVALLQNGDTLDINIGNAKEVLAKIQESLKNNELDVARQDFKTAESLVNKIKEKTSKYTPEQNREDIEKIMSTFDECSIALNNEKKLKGDLISIVETLIDGDLVGAQSMLDQIDYCDEDDQKTINALKKAIKKAVEKAQQPQ